MFSHSMSQQAHEQIGEMDCFYLLSVGVRSVPFHLRPLNWSEYFLFAWHGWEGTFIKNEEEHSWMFAKKREKSAFFISA